MTPEACHLLRHDIAPRWIGDLLAAYCLTCEHLWVPSPVTTARSALEAEGPSPLAPLVPSAVRAAVAAPAG